MSLQIGIVFEGFDAYPKQPGDPADYAAEYEPESTVAVIEASFRRLGHEVIRLGTPHALLAAIASGEVKEIDVALTIAEGYGSRNREAWAASLLEMAGIPALGSDALTLSFCLDKAWTQRTVAAAGIGVAAHCLMEDRHSAADGDLPAAFPLFVKPRWEGTSKGIGASSRVENREELAREVDRIARDYRQPALVEAFVPGAEYTVTVVGNSPPRALPVLQRALDLATGIGLHAIVGVHSNSATDSEPTPSPSLDRFSAPDHYIPGDLTPVLEAELQRLALRCFELFECLDFARIDFRLDAAGEPVFLEINPLPTFALDGSFGILAELAGRPVEELLAEVFEEALVRLGSRPHSESHE